MSDQKPSECIRKRDKMYKELDLENKKKTENQIIKLMVEYPGLILRPIVVSKRNVHFGKITRETIK